MNANYCVVAFLWAGEGGLDGLQAFENTVLPILTSYQGKLMLAINPSEQNADQPDEIHVLQFPSRSVFDEYQKDPRHKLLEAQRKFAISRTTLFSSDTVIPYESLQKLTTDPYPHAD